ncbi:uncharacterized protein PAF06_013505 [Gastrophryne carolinensis]
MKLGNYLFSMVLCLAFGQSSGDSEWQLANRNVSEEDVIKELNQALHMVAKPTFQGWKAELIQQAVPRMHIGLVELWLQFRRLQREQEDAWRKMKGMTATSTMSCQELKEKITDLSATMRARLEGIEDRMEAAQRGPYSMEDVHLSESTRHPWVGTTEPASQMGGAQTTPSTHRSCSLGQCRDNTMTGRRRSKITNTQLAHKVAALTELLNGHNELLVELYQRVTALEGAAARGPPRPEEGSGGGH